MNIKLDVRNGIACILACTDNEDWELYAGPGLHGDLDNCIATIRGKPSDDGGWHLLEPDLNRLNELFQILKGNVNVFFECIQSPYIMGIPQFNWVITYTGKEDLSPYVDILHPYNLSIHKT